MAPDAPGCTCAPLRGACRQTEGGELVGASCLLGGQGLGLQALLEASRDRSLRHWCVSQEGGGLALVPLSLLTP